MRDVVVMHIGHIMIHGSSIINVKYYRKVIDIGIKILRARGYSLRLCIKLNPFRAYTFSKKGRGAELVASARILCYKILVYLSSY